MTFIKEEDWMYFLSTGLLLIGMTNLKNWFLNMCIYFLFSTGMFVKICDLREQIDKFKEEKA